MHLLELNVFILYNNNKVTGIKIRMKTGIYRIGGTSDICCPKLLRIACDSEWLRFGRQ